jgi:hypothetical protein
VAFRIGDVVVHNGGRAFRFGRAREGNVVGSRGDPTGTAGNEHGDKGLFKVIAGALGGV